MGSKGSPRQPARPPAGLLAGLMVVALLAAPLTVDPGLGTSGVTPIMDAQLPTGRDGTSAVRLGEAIYVFGGDTGARSTDILRYDPLTDTLTTLGLALPTARSGTSVVAAGGVAYLFGGWNGGTYSDQILRFDPAGPTLTVMSASLPSGRTYTSAVWDGTYAYVFGGGVSCSPCTTDQIVRYHPATDTVDVMQAKLPTRRYGTSAVWDGTHAYLFGGVTASTNTEHDDVLRYHPATDTIATLDLSLPTPRYHTSAAYVDGRAHVFGGFPCPDWPHHCTEIVVFDPDTDVIGADGIVLPTGRYLTSAAAFGDSVFVFGGYDGARSRQILRYGADAGPDPGNLPPAIDPIGALGVILGDTLTVAITASDPNGDPLALSLTALPGGATFTDHGGSTATFSWPTGTSDEGEHAFTVHASDGHATTSRGFLVTVSEDPPPTLTPIADRVALEGTTLTIDITATDPGGDPVGIAVSPLPLGATLTDHGDGTATFLWNIGFAQAGVWALHAEATDGTHSVSEPFTITVQEVDRPPMFDATPPVTALLQAPLSLFVNATDPDGDAVLLSGAGLPSGAGLTDLGGGQGRVDWTPTSIGPHVLTIRATAGALSTDTTVPVQVLPAYSFTFTNLGTAFPKAAPGDHLLLTGRLTNTGYFTDTLQLSAQHTLSTGSTWLLTAPAPVTLARGGSALVTLGVDVPATGSKSRPHLLAASAGDPSLQRALTWVIEVPLHLSIQLHDPDPLVRDLSALAISGTVTATWWNGSPAIGQNVNILQTPQGLVRLQSERSGLSDATGTLAFDFSFDPAAALPGSHTLTATVVRAPLTHRASTTYAVEA